MNNFSSQQLLSLSFISGVLVGGSCIYFLNQIKIKKMENKIYELKEKNLDLLEQLMYFDSTPCQSIHDRDNNKCDYISYENI
jgi:hypothetical protein